MHQENLQAENLIFSFAKLIDLYKTDMTNDAPEVTEFMKTHTVKEILSNTALWDTDLSFIAEEVEKNVNS